MASSLLKTAAAGIGFGGLEVIMVGVGEEGWGCE